MEQFEKAFEDFLEGKEYEQAIEGLFYSVRKAFEAGWKLAGGKDTEVKEKFKEYISKHDIENEE